MKNEVAAQAAEVLSMRLAEEQRLGIALNHKGEVMGPSFPIRDSSARSAVLEVELDCAITYTEPQDDEREQVLREMKLSTM